MKQETNLSSLVWNQNLYPRNNISEIHVNHLCEALRAGESLPPIVADQKTGYIIDGVHRWTALRKTLGDAASVECDVRPFADEAEMLRSSIELNSSHRLRLETSEQTRCLILAKEMGIAEEETAKWLRITYDRAIRLVSERTAIYRKSDGTKQLIPLKGGSVFLAGEAINKKQKEFNASAGGMNPTYYVNQVIAAIEAGAVERCQGEFVQRLSYLRELLNTSLPKAKRRSARAAAD